MRKIKKHIYDFCDDNGKIIASFENERDIDFYEKVYYLIKEDLPKKLVNLMEERINGNEPLGKFMPFQMPLDWVEKIKEILDDKVIVEVDKIIDSFLIHIKMEKENVYLGNSRKK